MDVRGTQRRWLPGRQTLSRTEATERGESATVEAPDNQDGSLFDPVYDWFDLRRGTTPGQARPTPE